MNPRSSSVPRVLVVTSDRELESRVKGIVAPMHYSVQTIQDIFTSVEVLPGRNPPEIALLGADLGIRNAMEFAARVNSSSGRKQTWILLLTPVMDSATVASAVKAGIDDLLLCPSNTLLNDFELGVRLSIGARMRQLTQQDAGSIQNPAPDSAVPGSLDGLTGLWNREALLRQLFPETDRVQRMGTPLAVLLLDIDHFARINDEFGHGAGDALLRELANRLRRYLRSYDLLGRLGEDEFLIALPGCDSSEARRLASRIRTILLHRPFASEENFITVTGSIGLAQSRGRSPLIVLREAERALADAKLNGRNCECEYTPPKRKTGTSSEDRPEPGVL